MGARQAGGKGKTKRGHSMKPKESCDMSTSYLRTSGTERHTKFSVFVFLLPKKGKTRLLFNSLLLPVVVYGGVVSSGPLLLLLLPCLHDPA